MISKVVFFRYMPLTELICKGHFMDWLLINGISVEYLDLSRLIYPNYDFSDKTKRDYIINIDSYCELKNYLKNQNKEITLFISIVTFEWRVFKIFRILTQNNCKLGVFARGILPGPNTTSAIKIKRIINHFHIKRVVAILKNIASRLSKYYGWIKCYNVIFLTGINALPAIGVGFKNDSENAVKVYVNTADYDNYLEYIPADVVATPYAVFLDENLPFHPDTKLFNIEPIKAEAYFPELNAFFDSLEKDFKVKVVIAAHPKAVSYKNCNPFNGRDLHFNMTNELIANSDFVIAHDSTSIGYAVLHMKPILSATSSKLKESLPINHEHILSFSEFLNTSLIYYDSYNKNDVHLCIDIKRYNSYKFTYLTNKDTENKLTKSIFLESLTQL